MPRAALSHLQIFPAQAGHQPLASVSSNDAALIAGELIADRLDQPAFRRLMVDTIPFPRLGKPSDVAAAVAFLCSEDASFINGHVLVIDGGWSATNWVGSGNPA